MRRVSIPLVASALTAALVVGGAVTAYATGSIPDALMTGALVNDAWKADHCTGPAQGRPDLCPNPGHDRPTLPVGKGGHLVALGDSFSAGEGAPLDVFEKRRGSRGKGGSSTVWSAVSGFYPPTDQGGDQVCHRSPLAYPVLMAQKLDLSLDFRACSGATTKEFWKPQKRHYPPDVTGPDRPNPAQGQAAFPADTRLVTIGFGGNNAGFDKVVSKCLIDPYKNAAGVLVGLPVNPVGGLLARKYLDACRKTANSAAAVLPGSLGDEDDATGIYQLLKQVTTTAPPQARVILTSYPVPFPSDPDDKCRVNAATYLPAAEQSAVNAFALKLNEGLKAAALASGVDFVDMSYAFVPRTIPSGSDQDHGLCQLNGPGADPGHGERWMNYFRVSSEHTGRYAYRGTMHPNVLGQDAYARRLMACYQDRFTCDGFLDPAVWREPTLTAMKCLIQDSGGGLGTFEEIPADRLALYREWDRIQPREQDVTGDGAMEVVVEAQCPTTTSSRPTQFVVFDVRQREPRVLGVLGEHYFRDATLQKKDPDPPNGPPRVAIEGESVGENDPLCCPNHVAQEVYEWKDNQFVSVLSTEQTRDEAGVSDTGDTPADPGSSFKALITGVDSGAVTYDVIQWFEGAAAAQACEEDGVTGGAEWCSDYYVRNTNDLLRTEPLAADATVQMYDTMKQLQAVPPSAVAASTSVFTLERSGGQIQSITEVYTP